MNKTDTPQWIVNAFNMLVGADYFFDMSVCGGNPNFAKNINYSGGLGKPWHGVVFCDPQSSFVTWAKAMADHCNGVMLLPFKPETKLWQHEIFTTADGYLFPMVKLPQKKILIAWGTKSRNALMTLVDEGWIAGAFFDRAFYTGSRRS